MFEKYHLIHFEVEKPLNNGADEGLFISTNMDSLNDSTSANETYLWSDYAENSQGLQNSNYCLAGSFDMLLSLYPLENDVEPLHLQGLSILNSTKEFFFQRFNYNSLLLSYTYAGEGHLLYKDKEYSIKKGEAFIIDCRQHHKYYTEGDSWKHIDIHIWGNHAQSIYQHFENEDITHISFPEQDFNHLVERLLDTCVTFSDHRHLLISNALSNLLCNLLNHAEKEGHSTIPEAYRYIIHYMESNYKTALSLDSLASFINVSKFYFAREFKRYTNYSPNEYLLALRIQHACIMLANTDLSIEEIANEVGIHNMSNFIKQFKKRTGVTPSKFRNGRNNIF